MTLLDRSLKSLISDPVIIGGVGGSGTRLFAETLLASGIRSSSLLNGASDALCATVLFKRVGILEDIEDGERFERIYEIMEAALEGGRPLSRPQRQLVKAAAGEERRGHSRRLLKRYARRLKRDARRPADPTRWFFKEPNMHWSAPEILRIRPNVRFIMVVRHGVDMAFSGNQQQVALWGPTVLGEPDLRIEAASSLRYWCHVHRRIMGLKERDPDRTLIVSFDQLCQQPEQVMPGILEFAGIESSPDLLQRVLSGVKVPASIGRHLKEDLSVFNPEDIDFVKAFMATIEAS